MQRTSKKCGFAVSLNSHDAAKTRMAVSCLPEARARLREPRRTTATPVALRRRRLARVAEDRPATDAFAIWGPKGRESTLVRFGKCSFAARQSAAFIAREWRYGQAQRRIRRHELCSSR